MRRWVKDQIRLALRKALPRLIAFACLPTEKEMDRLIAAAMKREFELWTSHADRTPDRRVLH